jgi:hypothetical protein
MNVNEPDKLEQLTVWAQQATAEIESGLNWLGSHLEVLAALSAVVVLGLATILVIGVRWRNSNPEVSGWRHASR